LEFLFYNPNLEGVVHFDFYKFFVGLTNPLLSIFLKMGCPRNSREDAQINGGIWLSLLFYDFINKMVCTRRKADSILGQ
jgi:hypothetical protein